MSNDIDLFFMQVPLYWQMG